MTQPVETPQGLTLWTSAQSVQAPTPTMQSSVDAGPSGVAATMPVIGGGEPSAIATTIAVNAPSPQEAEEAFAEISSAFQEMHAKHRQMQEGVRTLASTVEALHQAKLGEVETIA